MRLPKNARRRTHRIRGLGLNDEFLLFKVLYLMLVGILYGGERIYLERELHLKELILASGI